MPQHSSVSLVLALFYPLRLCLSLVCVLAVTWAQFNALYTVGMPPISPPETNFAPLLSKHSSRLLLAYVGFFRFCFFFSVILSCSLAFSREFSLVLYHHRFGIVVLKDLPTFVANIANSQLIRPLERMPFHLAPA